jgi:hypothetical protein
LALAQSLGATALKRPLELHSIYGIVIDACGDADVLRQAIRATEPEGIITSCTIHRGDATALPLQEMYWKGITFRTGRPNVRAQMESVLDLCASGFDPSALHTIIAPFDEAPEAFLDPAVSVAVSRGGGLICGVSCRRIFRIRRRPPLSRLRGAGRNPRPYRDHWPAASG